jgi:DNA-binding transcriptional LysR family regulator
MRRLERELGVELFDRSTHPVSLTRAGRVFAVDARKILSEVQLAANNARAAADPHDRLRVGFLGAAANSLLPQTVRRFRQQCPQVNLVLEEHESGLAQLSLLRQGRIDLGLVREPSDEPGLACSTIFNEPFVLILPSDHGLADSNEPISLRDLADEAFVFWSRSSAPSPFDTAIHSFHDLGLDMPIVQEALGVQTILGLVAAGIGVSLLPESVTALHRDGVISRPLRAPRPTIPLCAVWRIESVSPTLTAFLTALQDAVPAA